MVDDSSHLLVFSKANLFARYWITRDQHCASLHVLKFGNKHKRGSIPDTKLRYAVSLDTLRDAPESYKDDLEAMLVQKFLKELSLTDAWPGLPDLEEAVGQLMDAAPPREPSGMEAFADAMATGLANAERRKRGKPCS